MRQGSLYTLMFHGIVSSKPDHFLYGPNTNCFVREKDFEKLIRYCSKKYRVLKLKDLASYLNGTATEDGVLITFDDGLQSLYTLGLPILKKYNATATVFITSDWTNKGIQPAVFSLEYLLYHHLPATVNIYSDGFIYEKRVDTKENISPSIDAIWAKLFENKISPLSLTDQQITINSKPLNLFEAEPGGGYWKPVSWEILQQAVKEGTIEIGAHGKTHTPFAWLSKEQLENELNENKEVIEKKLQANVTSCSFPHGSYDANTLSILPEYFTYGFANKMVSTQNKIEKLNITRYNVPFQRPNNIPLLIGYPFLGKVLRKFGSVTGLF